MLSGYYTIASGVLTRQREIDTIGNNLVNAQTPGYRANRLIISSFEQELLNRKDAYSDTVIGASAATAAVVDEVATNFDSGSLSDTGRVFDAAISGGGFFSIQGAGGETFLTRNGHFDMDEDGYLILPEVGRVMGSNGPVQVGSSDFVIGQSGQIYNSDGNYIDTLRISELPEGTVPEELENGVFGYPAGTQLQAAGNPSVIHKSLELSNIDYNREMTLLLESQRAFQACSSALEIIDSLNKKAHQIAQV